MISQLGHLQYNVRPDNLPFYRDLFGQLGWKTLHDGDAFLGLAGDGPASIWFAGMANDHVNDYDGAGHNHLGITVSSLADVDAMAAWLGARGIGLLFDTPRHRPEFAGGEGQTYYQIMFETPDRILLEIVYSGAM